LSPRNSPLGQRPGSGKYGQNNAKTPLLVMFPSENLKPKTKKFFFYFDFETRQKTLALSTRKLNKTKFRE